MPREASGAGRGQVPVPGSQPPPPPVAWRRGQSARAKGHLPPVCAKHVRAAARLCPCLEGKPTVFLARSPPLHGVHGNVYGLSGQGVRVVAQPDYPLPYGHPNTFLASQLIRRLSSFRAVDLNELLINLQEPA